jgi:CRP-like cAMP-binding protein
MTHRLRELTTGVLHTVRNRILKKFAQVDPDGYARFSATLEEVRLERGAVLGTGRRRPEHVHFVDTGLVSLVATTRAGHSLDVAIVGSEGVAGVADALGQNPLPYAWVVQLDGLAYRAPTAVLREHILSCSELHELLMSYSQSLVHQLAQSALCNRFHTAPQRLARWLLLTADRAGTTDLVMTHELMAQMVGAPRSAISQAAGKLRDQGIIEYHRGVLTIRNEGRLREAACECFDSIVRALEDDPGPGPSSDTAR